jgi:hypothetical protein
MDSPTTDAQKCPYQNILSVMEQECPNDRSVSVTMTL